MPVYDKPMIYYPLSTLMMAGIREILVISTPRGPAAFRRPAGRRQPVGLDIQYAEQPSPGRAGAGVHHRPRSSSASAPSALILGDNIFYGNDLARLLARTNRRAGRRRTVFAYHVHDPERYGVVEFDDDFRALSIEEKPAAPRSQLRGDRAVLLRQRRARHRRGHPSPRRAASWRSPMSTRATWTAGKLAVEMMGRGYAWLDTGTHDSLGGSGAVGFDAAEAAGADGGLPGGNRLPAPLDRCRAAGPAGQPLGKSHYGKYSSG